MTRDELKAKLTPIVIDVTLTKEQRDAKLLLIVPELKQDGRSFSQMCELWNSVMAEIVDENGLARPLGEQHAL